MSIEGKSIFYQPLSRLVSAFQYYLNIFRANVLNANAIFSDAKGSKILAS